MNESLWGFMCCWGLVAEREKILRGRKIAEVKLKDLDEE